MYEENGTTYYRQRSHIAQKGRRRQEQENLRKLLSVFESRQETDAHRRVGDARLRRQTERERKQSVEGEKEREREMRRRREEPHTMREWKEVPCGLWKPRELGL